MVASWRRLSCWFARLTEIHGLIEPVSTFSLFLF
jgi:hypothetical protein